MVIKNVYSVFFSPTGTTKKVVQSIAGSLSPDYECLDLTYDRRIDNQIFFPEDVLVFGVPVYGGRIPEILESCMEAFQGNGAMCVPVVVYGNRAFDDALKELSDILEERGFSVAAAGAFVGEHSYGREIAGGRPNETDLMTARRFGEKIIEKISYIGKPGDAKKLWVPGNHPYKERGAGGAAWCPETTDACNQCGRCVKACPVGIICEDNPAYITEPVKCQHCCACVKACPVGAKIMTSGFYLKFRHFLIENCSSLQKQPELFL